MSQLLDASSGNQQGGRAASRVISCAPSLSAWPNLAGPFTADLTPTLWAKAAGYPSHLYAQVLRRLPDPDGYGAELASTASPPQLVHLAPHSARHLIIPTQLSFVVEGACAGLALLDDQDQVQCYGVLRGISARVRVSNEIVFPRFSVRILKPPQT